MQRIEINIHEKELCLSWLFTKIVFTPKIIVLFIIVFIIQNNCLLVLHLLYAYRRTDRLSDIIRRLAAVRKELKLFLCFIDRYSSNTCELILALEQLQCCVRPENFQLNLQILCTKACNNFAVLASVSGISNTRDFCMYGGQKGKEMPIKVA